MTSSFKKLPGSLIELSVSVPLAEFKREIDHAFDRARAELAVKGFRKGMVPESLAREIISHKRLFDDTAESTVKSTLSLAAEEHAWTLVGRPKVEIADDPASFSYVATFPVFPAVVISGYEKIAERGRVALAARKAALGVTPEEEADALRMLRESRATLTAAARPAAAGDAVKIEVISSLGDKPHSDRFIIGHGRFMPGFEEKIVGLSAGEKASFRLTAPAGYWKEDLRGKTVDFDVTMTSVFDRKVPEAHDAFAASLGKIKDLAELTANIRNGLLAEKTEREESVAAQKILQDIVAQAAIDIPEAMVAAMKERDPDAADQDLRRNIATHLVIYAIAERENLRPAEDEIAREMAHHNAGARGEKPIDTPRLHDYIYERIQQKNVYAKLLGTDRH